MITTAALDLTALARAAVAASVRTFQPAPGQGALRPIDRRLAVAELQGIFRAISALGLAPTPFAAELALSDALGKVPGTRPTRATTGVNADLRAYDEAWAAAFAAELGWA